MSKVISDEVGASWMWRQKNPKLPLQYWITTIRALLQNQILLYGLQISGVVGNDFMSLNTTMPTTSTVIEHSLSWGNFQQKMVQASTNIFQNYPTTEFQMSILPGPRSSPSAISGWDPEMLRKLERRFSFQATTCKQQLCSIRVSIGFSLLKFLCPQWWLITHRLPDAFQRDSSAGKWSPRPS